MTTSRRIAVVICVLGVANLAGAAEIFTYDTPAELFGASLAVTQGLRELVRRTADYCGQTFPEMKADSREAVVEWSSRHADFLALTASMRQSALAVSDPEKAAQLKQLIEDYLPKQTAAMADTLVRSIEDMPRPEVKQAMCRNTIGAVNAGKFDIETRDPAVAKYLRGVLGKQPKELAASADPDPIEMPASPSSRTDALPLHGRWKVISTKYYLFNGTTRSTTTNPCHVEYSEQRVVSECERGTAKLRVVYTYRLLEPGRYEAEIVEHSTTSSLIGTRSLVVFRVEQGKLYIVAYPATAPTTAETAPLKVISILQRN